MNALFICNQNQNRSKTAEEIFEDRFKTNSAGLFNEKPVGETELKWADTIFVMEDFQRSELSERFPSIYLEKQILSLNVPDIFFYKQPELINLLETQMNELFPTNR